MHLTLVHCAPAHASTATPAHATTAPALALVATAAYVGEPSTDHWTVMARTHAAAYTETEAPGVNIYRLRTARGWSQRELARRVDPPADPSAISRLEHNDGFTQDSLQRVAAALGVTYQALFYPPEIVAYATLPESVRARLADTIADVAAAYTTRRRTPGQR